MTYRRYASAVAYADRRSSRPCQSIRTKRSQCDISDRNHPLAPTDTCGLCDGMASAMIVVSLNTFFDSFPRTPMTNLSRRNLLKGTAIALIGEKVARGGVVAGHLPWEPNAGSPPQAVPEGPWTFFTAAEGAAVEALVGSHHSAGSANARAARTRAARSSSIGNSPAPMAGMRVCTTRGRSSRAPKPRPQSAKNPGELYRSAIAALEHYCQSQAKAGSILPPSSRMRFCTGLRAAPSPSRASMARPSSHIASRTCRKDFSQTLVRRQPRHVRVENDRLPGRTLRLSRLGRAAQRALPSPAGEHPGAPRLDAETVKENQAW